MKTASFILCVLIAAVVGGCSTAAQQQIDNGVRSVQPAPIASPNPIVPGAKPSEKLSELCKQLSQIKKLPDGKDPSEKEDPIYAAVVSRGTKILPCLVDQITNVTPMDDPRSAPSWQNYKVGDTAVFILADMNEDPEILEKMLPSPFREEWETNGVYAYFNYVFDANNRRKLQSWWRSHLEKK